MVRSTVAAGFTLIELLVVLLVMAIIAVLAFFGLNSSNNQPLINAQKEFLVQMRSVQNQVNSGSDGVDVKSVLITPNANSYTIINSYYGPSGTIISSTPLTLPSGITVSISPNGGSNVVEAICFTNPNLTSFSAGQQQCLVSATTPLSGCTSGVGIVCDGLSGGPAVNANSVFTVTLTNQTGQTKAVIIEGAGMKINRIYAQ